MLVRCAPIRRQVPRVPYWWRGHPVFLSYRRAGCSFASGWLRDRLVAKLGPYRVIRDVDCIPAGISFLDFIDGVIPDCRAVLALIDPEWTVSAAANEWRYAATPGDMVAFELASAFAAGVDVIPVLVRGASMPQPNALPEALRRLSQLQSIELRPDHNFYADVDRLVVALKQR